MKKLNNARTIKSAATNSDKIRAQMIVDAATKNAVVMNGELVANIPLDLLFVDKSYQREIRGTRSDKIVDMANHFDYAKAGQIVVSYREDMGQFAIIDGQGRWRAAKLAGLQSLLANIQVNISRSEEAAQFAQQDKNSVRVNEHNKFNAGLVAAEENSEYAAYPELSRIMKAYGVKTPGHVSAITVALNTMKKDPVECEWIFKTIRQANWHEYKAGYSQYIMKALAIIYEEQPQLMAQVDKNLIPFMQKTNPSFFRDAAGMYGSNYATKARNVASIMMKLLSGDAVMESKLKTLLAENKAV